MSEQKPFYDERAPAACRPLRRRPTLGAGASSSPSTSADWRGLLMVILTLWAALAVSALVVLLIHLFTGFGAL